MDNLRDVSLFHTEPIVAGWYELGNTSNEEHDFVLKAANAEVILTSEHCGGAAATIWDQVTRRQSTTVCEEAP